MPAALALDGIEKRYGPVQAVAGVSLSFDAGVLHAVVGENGAGKSTLLKIGAGVIVPDAGSVVVDGAKLAPHDAREAIVRGVGMVHQHFSLIPALSALDNALLGTEPVRAFGRIDREAGRAHAEATAQDLGVTLPWDAPVAELGVGQRQRLEIVRALMRGARVLILDEPTAVLTPGEAAALYGALRQMTRSGRAVVVVTHHLDEVREYADVASVLRRGRLVSTRRLMGALGELTKGPRPSTPDLEEAVRLIAHDIMGEDLAPPVTRPRTTPGAVALRVRDLRVAGSLDGLSLDVRAGEVVGLAGVEGNGQRELVRVLAGLEAPDAGMFQPHEVIVVHEDRQTDGLVLDASVRENLVLGELADFTSVLGLVDRTALETTARARLDRSGVVPADLDAPVRALSGGNQQKIVVERAVARSADGTVVVLAHPTRGVDMGAARAIHTEIARMASEGKAVLVLSADLGELRLLADRILVMSRGRIVAELPPDATDAQIGGAMLGTAAATPGAAA